MNSTTSVLFTSLSIQSLMVLMWWSSVSVPRRRGLG
jgi:hypothetical protein